MDSETCSRLQDNHYSKVPIGHRHQPHHSLISTTVHFHLLLIFQNTFNPLLVHKSMTEIDTQHEGLHPTQAQRFMCCTIVLVICLYQTISISGHQCYCQLPCPKFISVPNTPTWYTYSINLRKVNLNGNEMTGPNSNGWTSRANLSP